MYTRTDVMCLVSECMCGVCTSLVVSWFMVRTWSTTSKGSLCTAFHLYFICTLAIINITFSTILYISVGSVVCEQV